MKSARAIARQTRAAEGSAQRVEELHALMTQLAAQLADVQAQLAAVTEALTRPAEPSAPAKK